MRLLVCLLLVAAPAIAQEDPLPAGAAARLGSIRYRSAHVVSCLAYSPAASCSPPGTMVA